MSKWPCAASGLRHEITNTCCPSRTRYSIMLRPGDVEDVEAVDRGRDHQERDRPDGLGLRLVALEQPAQHPVLLPPAVRETPVALRRRHRQATAHSRREPAAQVARAARARGGDGRRAWPRPWRRPPA